jgi:hypothetical protein
LLFLFLKKKEFLLAAVLFKTDCFVELGIGILFPEGKRRFKLDTGKPLSPPYRGQIPLFSRVFRQF